MHPVDPDSELRKHPYCTFWCFIQLFYLECLKRTWRSPIYSFFKTDKVSVQYHNGRLCHFFPCAARKCKTVAGGVRRFQDSADRASTANLRHHALRCFGEEAVHNGTRGSDNNGMSGSIFSAFARQGQKPACHSHRSHTNAEVRYDIFIVFLLERQLIVLQRPSCKMDH